MKKPLIKLFLIYTTYTTEREKTAIGSFVSINQVWDEERWRNSFTNNSGVVWHIYVEIDVEERKKNLLASLF
jgi:hypothetical protein